jgi:hypothetical protein
LMWICLQIAVFLQRCHMIGPSHAWHYACSVQVHAIMYLNDVQRAAFYEGIGLDTGVDGIWTVVNVTGPPKFVRNNIAGSSLVKHSENFASWIGGQVESDVNFTRLRVLGRFVFWSLSRFCSIFISGF